MNPINEEMKVYVGFDVLHTSNQNSGYYAQNSCLHSPRVMKIMKKQLDMNIPLIEHQYSQEIGTGFHSNGNSVYVELQIQIAKPIKTKDLLDVEYPKLNDDFELLLKNESLSDITIVVKAKEFKAHEVILMARSPVFATMLACDMLEKKTNKVKIEDMEPEIFEALLIFIYSGKQTLIDPEKMCNLLKAADKYAIHDLKPFCEENIIETISIDNAADIFTLADLVKCEDLKMNAMKFILENKNQVVKTDAYKDMIKLHLHLVEQMFCQE